MRLKLYDLNKVIGERRNIERGQFIRIGKDGNLQIFDSHEIEIK